MKNCQETTMDIERSKYERISGKDRLGLRLHLAMCRACRCYYKDSKKIDHLLEKKFRNLDEYKFSREEKSSLKQRISR